MSEETSERIGAIAARLMDHDDPDVRAVAASALTQREPARPLRTGRADYPLYAEGAFIPDDEPVFVIRAKDAAAPATVRFWAQRAASLGADDATVAVALGHATAMEEYQARHGRKVPDLPKE